MGVDLRFFTATFEGFWPVGTAAVVVAVDEADARRLLESAIRERGLEPKDIELTGFDPDERKATILLDGNY